MRSSDLTFFQNLFTSIAEEMGGTLLRTAYSPNIKERRDFSCALFDIDSKLIAQAAHIPVHLGSMPMSVKAALSAHPDLCEGDAVILNDPYAGGTHLPDITMVTPVMLKSKEKKESPGAPGKPFMFLATRAHHADVGGMTPGSLPLSREIYQEGLRLPPLKLSEKGHLNKTVLDILAANVRTPGERAGDLRAQIAAHEVGSARVCEVVQKYGVEKIKQQMRGLLDYGERLMSESIRRIPDGVYRFEDFLDGDGINSPPIKIRVSLSIRGGKAAVDFTGSDPESDGCLNAVESITRSAVYYCFLCLLVTQSHLEAALLSDPPVNAGCFRPITVILPEGSIVNARPPRAVAGGNVETSQRIVDVCFGALARAIPGLVPAASQGTMNNLTLGGYDTGRGQPFAYYETIGGGMGARPIKDGIDGVHVHMTNTMNTPVEALEFAYPLRVERYEIVRGTGGKGRWRGGDGMRRDVKILCDARGTILSERRSFAPYGLRGGASGRPGQNLLLHEGRQKKLPGKMNLDLKKGDIISVRTPGGGGWGKPSGKRR